VTFQVSNAMALPFPDNSFDVAISQAMLVLAKDKVKTIKEANRVVNEGGRAGWLELSWKAEIDAGITDLLIKKGNNVRGTFFDRLRDEGLLNMVKIFINTMSNKEIRKRSRLMQQFFREHDQYFGLGIYVFTKHAAAPFA
jgi:ubiquinone/menaquinone biosynthesis C-methylase UbiE